MRSRTVQYAIAALVFFLIAFAGYAGLFYLIRTGNEEISIMRAQVEQEVNREQRLIGFQSIIRDTELERSELDTYFIGRDGVVSFLELLESFGDTANVSVEVSTVEVVTERRVTTQNGKEVELPPPAVESLQVIVSVGGSFEEVFHYLTLLETMPFHTAINSVSIERARSEGVAWSGLFGFDTLKIR